MVDASAKNAGSVTSTSSQTQLEREIASVAYYSRPIWRYASYLLLGIGTLGAFFLFSWWIPELAVWIMLSSCDVRSATFVFIKLKNGSKKITKIERARHQLDGQDARYFVFQQVRFMYDADGCTFKPSAELPHDFQPLLRDAVARVVAGELPSGIDEKARAAKQEYYGKNVITVPRPSLALIFARQALHPLVVFQYFAVIIWCYEMYYSYSAIVFFITFTTVVINSYTEYSVRKKLAAAAHYVCDVQVVKDGSLVTMSSSEVVPGDVVVVTAVKAAFDMVVLDGECVADETALTGESIPVRKVAYRLESGGKSYSSESNATSTIFGGTTVIVTRAVQDRPVLAVVSNTGFMTARGKIIRMILYPRAHDVHFQRQALIFIGIMFIIGLAFYGWDIAEMVKYDADPVDIGIKACDMITVAVPPALPCCMAIATVVVVSRLAKKKIHVLEQDRINFAGTINTVCFDKTGTLTEIGLRFKGLLAVVGGQFGNRTCDPSEFPQDTNLLFGACHGLTEMGEAGGKSEAVGDPLDCVLYETSGFTMKQGGIGSDGSLELLLTHPKEPSCVHRVLKRYDFSSDKMRCAALVQTHDGRLVFLVKGSPERLLAFMDESTVPDTFHKVLDEEAKEGLRVIAVAQKALNMSAAEALATRQEDLEKGAQLLGLALMVNMLKPASTGVIEHLQRARIHTIMVTGDHVKTAISISRQCTILDSSRSVVVMDAGEGETLTYEVHDDVNSIVEKIDEYTALKSIAEGEVQVAVTGRAFNIVRFYEEATFRGLVLRHASVYARMSPEDKRALVDMLGEGEIADDGTTGEGLGLQVAFIGDGANDLGALKGALVGVSLCDTEASIAAPLTSQTPDVSCMIDVIGEGRTSLVTSFIIFKFMMVYAFIQVFSLAMLYSLGLTVGNWQYLIQDLFYATASSAAMSMTHPAPTLSKRRPNMNLVSIDVLLPVVAMWGLCAGFQVMANEILKTTDWFVPYQFDYDYVLGIEIAQKQPQCGVFFIMGLAQLMIATLVFNVGRPFRKSIWTNWVLMIVTLAQLGFLLYCIWAPNDMFLRHGPAIAVGHDIAYTPVAPPPEPEAPPPLEASPDSPPDYAPVGNPDWPDYAERPLSWRAILFGIVCANAVVAFAVDRAAYYVIMYVRKYLDRVRADQAKVFNSKAAAFSSKANLLAPEDVCVDVS